MNGVIYMYTSPSGKQYIGQTVNERKRKWDHANAVSTSYFHSAIKKYGYDSFEYEILHYGISSKKALNVLERLEIISRDTLSPNGYNLNTGGDSRLASQAAKEALSKAHAGKPNPHRWSPVACVETGEIFESRTAAGESKGIDPCWISMVVDCPHKSTKGFHWCSPQNLNSIDKSRLTNRENKIEVQCYETGEIFLSLIEAVRKFRPNAPNGRNIAIVLDNPNKTAYGYHWVTPGKRHAATDGGSGGKRKILRVEDGTVFLSLKDAAKSCNIKSSSSITHAAKKRAVAGGYHWQYVD